MGQLLLITGSNAAAATMTVISDANADAIQLQGAASAGTDAPVPGIQAGSFIDIVSNGSLFFVNGKLNGTGSAMSTT